MACVCRSEDPDPSSKLREGPGERREAVTVFLPNEEETAPETDAECCCTPTAKEYRIPETVTCPPAPRKRRETRSGNCFLRGWNADPSSKLQEGPGERREAVTVFLPNEEETAPETDAECCCTPTAKECRIPETLTCPPAPRKRRADEFSSLPSVRPKEYFVPHNLDAFFTSVSVPKAKYFR